MLTGRHFLTLMIVASVASACGDSSPSIRMGVYGGGPVSDAAVESDARTASDGARPGDDASTPSDAATPGDGAATPFTCDDCAFGCDATGLACLPPAISNVPVELADGATATLVIEAGIAVVLDTDSGQISGRRPAGTGIVDGIGFFTGSASMPSVLTVDALEVRSGATLRVRGSLPLAILATRAIAIDGTLDASAGCDGGARHCGGPGGGSGAREEGGSVLPSTGCGAGGSGVCSGRSTDVGFRYFTCGGGGGGAHIQAGASAVTAGPGGSAVACGDGTLAPLHGGSGGGAGGLGGEGGGGGGAIQLVSFGAIRIGGTGVVLASGAGGGGGELVNYYPGRTRTYPVAGGGGGAGAGGGILIEAPIVDIARGAIVAANGGGGGAASTSGAPMAGEDGRDDTTQALGGDPGAACAPTDVCGPGGAGGSALGAPATGGRGGGGAGAGAIHVRALPTGYRIDGGAILSPMHTTGLLGPAR